MPLRRSHIPNIQRARDVLSAHNLQRAPQRTGIYGSTPEGHISYGLHTDSHHRDPCQLFCEDLAIFPLFVPYEFYFSICFFFY